MTRTILKGLFITLEGIDGTGKSTQCRLLAEHLRKLGYRVCATREPGGTHVGEQIRSILLASRNKELTALAELALMYAARAQHLDEVIRPALLRGEIVVSDRFNDASLAYQGYGRGLGVETVRALDCIICGPTQPDLVLLLDVSPRLSLRRAHERERSSRRQRFEAQGLKFHERVRAGYLAIARSDPNRVKVIHANRAVGEIQENIRELVGEFLGATQKENQKSKGPMKNKTPT